MKKLYEGVIVPKMLYAADVWCAGLVEKGRGKKGKGRGARGFASQMARVQRMATISIAGGLRSSPTDMLDAHANVLPFQQTLRKTCYRATLRMATLPQKHPLAKGIKNAYDYGKERDFKGKKRYPSPLHKLMYEFRINPSTVEKIDPVRHYPKWEPDVDIHIAEKAETAKIEDGLADENLRAYSDGSMVDGGVGGAAVVMRDNEVIGSKRFHLGSDREHTVYEAELVGMILAVQLLKETGGRRGTISLGVDNQAAIRATEAFRSQPGHYLTDQFHDDLRRLIPEHDESKLKVRWTPGHVGIPGNEEADTHAKRAARGESSDTRAQPKSLLTEEGELRILPRSKAALRQHFYAKIKKEATTIMENSPRYTLLKSVDTSAPSKKFAKKIEKLPRRHSSLMFQLRTGHIALNKHLKRIAKSPTARCPACENHDETVHHFILVCPAYVNQREQMRKEVGARQCKIEYLLNESKGMRATLTYIARTRRLEQTFGDVTPPAEKEKE